MGTKLDKEGTHPTHLPPIISRPQLQYQCSLKSKCIAGEELTESYTYGIIQEKVRATCLFEKLHNSSMQSLRGFVILWHAYAFVTDIA